MCVLLLKGQQQTQHLCISIHTMKTHLNALSRAKMQRGKNLSGHLKQTQIKKTAIFISFFFCVQCACVYSCLTISFHLHRAEVASTEPNKGENHEKSISLSVLLCSLMGLSSKYPFVTLFALLVQKGKATVARQAQGLTQPEGLIPVSSSVKHQTEFLPPPLGRYEVQGVPPAECRHFPFIHLDKERQCGASFLYEKSTTITELSLEPVTLKSYVMRADHVPQCLHLASRA